MAPHASFADLRHRPADLFRSRNRSDTCGRKQMNMESPLKTMALITGANKGIGYEVARQLAASGCTILIGARRQIQGEEAAAKLAAEGLDVHYVPIDLDNSTTIAAAARKIDEDFGRLDILINNAGIAAPGDGPPSAR